MRFFLHRQVLLCVVAASTAAGAELDKAGLEAALAKLVQGIDGRIGACVQAGERVACIRAEEKFSLQSVVKMAVGVAVLDSVDRGARRLTDAITVHKQDLSLYVQPLAKLVGPAGYRTTIGDLVRRAVIDSDSAATDILIAQLGGPAAVQDVLSAKGTSGIRIDRDERHLQTEIVGLTWKPEYVDAAVLERAIAAVPAAKRQETYAKYQADSRDTSTPQGMVAFLRRLAQGDLLSKGSTQFLMKAMNECRTFPDRLKAGLRPGWKVAHKTGTSGSWGGVTAATNDVGVLTAPDGSSVSIAVFVADSRASSTARAALIARICTEAIAHYR
jgi:beta-lactamase class A